VYDPRSKRWVDATSPAPTHLAPGAAQLFRCSAK
jgi:hypothetical protein